MQRRGEKNKGVKKGRKRIKKTKKILSFVYILIVPLGPRLVLRTSCKPLAALMFMWRAADLFRTSAFGLSTLNDIFLFALTANDREEQHLEKWAFGTSELRKLCARVSLSLSLSSFRSFSNYLLRLSSTKPSIFAFRRIRTWTKRTVSVFWYCFRNGPGLSAPKPGKNWAKAHLSGLTLSERALKFLLSFSSKLHNHTAHFAFLLLVLRDPWKDFV